ncbi:MAG: flavin monoamine oxidase family protein [Caulobacteraceae bacterium]
MIDSVAMPLSRRTFLEQLGGVGGSALVMAGMSALGFGIESAAAAPPKLSGGGGKKIVVLGTGVAGLTSAYELSKAGYDVTVLEARDRVGGRSYTARQGTRLTELGGEPQVCSFDEGYYINPGPWRIPYHHHGYLHYVRTFGVPVELFNNDNDHSYVYFDKGSGPLARRAVRKQEIAADARGYAAEMLAKQVNQGALDQQLSAGDRELFLEYLRSEGYLTGKDFRYVGCAGRGFDVNPGAGVDPGPGKDSTPYALGDVLRSETWRTLKSVSDFDQQRTMFQPAGGMDRLPAAFVRNMKPVIRFEHVVEKIGQSGDQVQVTYVDAQGKRGVVVADYCICAIPLSVLRTIDLQVSDSFKKAIGGVSYSLVGKIGLQMKRRFWEEDHAIYGGHIYFDDPEVGSIALPSTGWLGRKGVLLGYYQFGAAAAKVSAKSLKDREAFAAAAGQKVFPQYAQNVESSFSIAWHRVPFNMGGWAQWSEEGRKEAYPILCEPDGRVYLAGEHLSYLTGWQEGGIESAWQQIAKLHKRVVTA